MIKIFDVINKIEEKGVLSNKIDKLIEILPKIVESIDWYSLGKGLAEGNKK